MVVHSISRAKEHKQNGKQHSTGSVDSLSLQILVVDLVFGFGFVFLSLWFWLHGSAAGRRKEVSDQSCFQQGAAHKHQTA